MIIQAMLALLVGSIAIGLALVGVLGLTAWMERDDE